MLVSQLRAAGSSPVHLDAEEMEATPLAQLLAYQVIREALHNAVKHARADSILVRIWPDDKVVRVNVTDDGSGFAWSEVDTERHFGLQIMKERVEAVGGVLFVDSNLGKGTAVVAAIPRNA
jgi:signal transduction histidine kinase